MKIRGFHIDRILLPAVCMAVCLSAGSAAAQENAGAAASEVQEIAGEASAEIAGAASQESAGRIGGLTFRKSMELSYATQFSVDLYEDDYALISISGEKDILVVPEGGSIPEGLDDSVVVLEQPLENIYLVATSSMDLFRGIGGIGSITLSGTDSDGWYIEEAQEAIDLGMMSYAGKYSAPDYELIVSKGCDLAVESTMIYHSPDVKEKLESFGIPVLVERSSYEPNPLGRIEWMKLYGVLLDKEEEAEAYFKEQEALVADVMKEENTGKTVAFFAVSTNGYVTVRKSGDYVARMIELAGGRYIFEDLGGDDNALSTMNMQMEDFYAGACDADYIIYNSAIESELDSMDELLAKSPLLADFKAVKEGNVWCTHKNLFQETTGIPQMIADIHTMITGGDESLKELTYMYRLE